MICDAVSVCPVAEKCVFVVVETNRKLALAVADANVELLRGDGFHLLS